MALFESIMESTMHESSNMNNEKYIKNKLSSLVPNADSFDVRANIGGTSYSIEFYTKIKDKKYQCYELVDIRLIKEKDLDRTFKDIADHIRSNSDYTNGKVNKYSFHVK